MKIKTDFVTNSSSTCYIFDKRNLTEKELRVVRKAGEGLSPPEYYGLGRSSTYAEGHEAIGYIHTLLGDELSYTPDSSLIQQFKKALEIGADNIIFARHSDESMGGDFIVPEPIDGKYTHAFEYH